ncbi:hypothetical protein FLJC2902T_25340 [Flavobacterium limnosediminis JC2902]|uniref:Uncharacterized protein n=1 Tax=Flavobacterium limnosediminis JC2902 TaxID=1341181 RepID=V6SJU2_9FLAO|nr:hypothetical protein [Flavobacterium limnosediminis]ESU26562.1 hypothetical protein FLJC2902T_25340 [Flavobacterium limnosediminis JC2902]
MNNLVKILCLVGGAVLAGLIIKESEKEKFSDYHKGYTDGYSDGYDEGRSS